MSGAFYNDFIELLLPPRPNIFSPLLRQKNGITTQQIIVF